jgi:FKBP-type peptidyl-prolyl cis-trans isomerase FkpA
LASRTAFSRPALVVTLLALGLPGCGGAQTPAEPAPAAAPALETEDAKTLYALGLALGQQVEVFRLTKEEIELVKAGFADAATKQTPKVDLQQYGPKIQGLAQARMAAAATEEKAAAAQYATEQGALPGAQVKPSGLIFTEVTAGTGASPAATDTVTVHYRGTLRDGTVFDSSIDRGQPTTFPLNQVIPCWTEGLQLMKVGGKAKLVCPSAIAYGDQGRPPQIPGGATLVFEVELLGIGNAQ